MTPSPFTRGKLAALGAVELPELLAMLKTATDRTAKATDPQVRAAFRREESMLVAVGRYLFAEEFDVASRQDE